jgi:hypothetical protein
MRHSLSCSPSFLVPTSGAADGASRTPPSLPPCASVLNSARVHLPELNGCGLFFLVAGADGGHGSMQEGAEAEACGGHEQVRAKSDGERTTHLWIMRNHSLQVQRNPPLSIQTLQNGLNPSTTLSTDFRMFGYMHHMVYVGWSRIRWFNHFGFIMIELIEFTQPKEKHY